VCENCLGNISETDEYCPYCGCTLSKVKEIDLPSANYPVEEINKYKEELIKELKKGGREWRTRYTWFNEIKQIARKIEGLKDFPFINDVVESVKEIIEEQGTNKFYGEIEIRQGRSRKQQVRKKQKQKQMNFLLVILMVIAALAFCLFYYFYGFIIITVAPGG
jgi:hypothetical protein